LAGFRSPTYAQGIDVAGFHLHFLQQDKQGGGHALDYRLRVAKYRFAPCMIYGSSCPPSAEFLKTNFEDRARAIDEQLWHSLRRLLSPARTFRQTGTLQRDV